MAWRMICEVKWLKEPPLFTTPVSSRRSISSGEVWIQPSRSPGAMILEKEPSESTRPPALAS